MTAPPAESPPSRPATVTVATGSDAVLPGEEPTGEGVSGHDLLRQAQLTAQSSDLVFVEVLQRLDDFTLQGGRQAG